jgi:hypothetical protein
VLPSKIPNRELRVRLCGLAEISISPRSAAAERTGRGTRGRAASPARNAARADRVAATWRALFEVPDGVEILPVCPGRKAEP